MSRTEDYTKHTITLAKLADMKRRIEELEAGKAVIDDMLKTLQTLYPQSKTIRIIDALIQTVWRSPNQARKGLQRFIVSKGLNQE